MKAKERAEPLDNGPLDEEGGIGEEQLPQGAGPKTDKYVWNYAADKTRGASGFSQWLKRVFGGEGEK